MRPITATLLALGIGIPIIGLLVFIAVTMVDQRARHEKHQDNAVQRKEIEKDLAKLDEYIKTANDLMSKAVGPEQFASVQKTLDDLHKARSNMLNELRNLR